jgi:hypothetical protein
VQPARISGDVMDDENLIKVAYISGKVRGPLIEIMLANLNHITTHTPDHPLLDAKILLKD